MLWVNREAWGYYLLVANQVITVGGFEPLVLGINHKAIHDLLNMKGISGIRKEVLFFKILTIDATVCEIREKRRAADSQARKHSQGSSRLPNQAVVSRL